MRAIVYIPVLIGGLYQAVDIYLDFATWRQLKTTNKLYEAATAAIILPITFTVPGFFAPPPLVE